jgi:hypothetical protein
VLLGTLKLMLAEYFAVIGQEDEHFHLYKKQQQMCFDDMTIKKG